jgi:hypothetical protein
VLAGAAQRKIMRHDGGMHDPAPQVVLAYVRTLAWPGVVTLGIVMFREKLADVMERLESISGAGFEAKIRAAEKQLTRRAPGTDLQLVAAESMSTVDDAWEQLEVAVRNYAQEKDVPLTLPIRQVVERLASQKTITRRLAWPFLGIVSLVEQFHSLPPDKALKEEPRLIAILNHEAALWLALLSGKASPVDGSPIP